MNRTTLAQLADRIADLLNRDRGEMRQLSRRLADVGLLPKGAGGRGGVRAALAGPQHAADFLIAAAWCAMVDSPKEAARATVMLRSLPLGAVDEAWRLGSQFSMSPAGPALQEWMHPHMGIPLREVLAGHLRNGSGSDVAAVLNLQIISQDGAPSATVAIGPRSGDRPAEVLVFGERQGGARWDHDAGRFDVAVRRASLIAGPVLWSLGDLFEVPVVPAAAA